MSSFPEGPDDAAKRQQLARAKRQATAALLVVTAGFLATLPFAGTPVEYLRAAAEASMVGGLADWFAVTALFRHPLGIPIPHTAIVPRRKDRVGRTLGQFVQRNFLSRPVIETKIRSLGVGERLAEWLSEPANARLIARQTVMAVSSGVQTLDDGRGLIAALDSGTVERVVVVGGQLARGAGSSVDRSFRAGERYAFFVTRADDGSLRDNACSSTAARLASHARVGTPSTRTRHSAVSGPGSSSCHRVTQSGAPAGSSCCQKPWRSTPSG